MRAITFCLLLLLSILCYVNALPVDDNSFVVTTDATKSDKEHQQDDTLPSVPKIYKMHIHSRIENRYANTTVTSKVRNIGKKAQEATFFVVLPDSAFISGFIMEIDGKNYTAYVEEKKKAQKTYDDAVSHGISAAHIAVTARDSNKFTVSVNVEPEKKATFYLFYEELLKRFDGYEMVINIHPKQPVPDLQVDVEINESSPIKYVKAPALRSGNDISDPKGDLDSRAVINQVNSTYATVTFKPDVERQKQLAHVLGTKEDEGLSGQFLIQYEVERENNGGEILLKDGHFVHFFSPDKEQKLPKYVLFVLDTSGSMYGSKMPQLKDAMNKILPDLKEDDLFSLVEFSSSVKVWDINDHNKSVQYPEESIVWNYDSLHSSYDNLTFPEGYVATKENIDKAKEVINNYQPDGGTNIYEALKIALHLYELELKKNKGFNKQPIIVFLTDGDPTVGVTATDEIINKLSEINLKKIPIFSLSFGSGADQKFLRKLSLRNSAFSRHIYEGADASLQLENFYKQISSPLLRDVHFKYTKDVADVSKTYFPIFFRGSEYVVAGRIPDKEFAKEPEIEAHGIHGLIHLKPVIKKTNGELERLWAYLTIKQLLDDKENAKNTTEYDQKALDLALKYSFVTPVSSLVVVKPNDTKAVDAEAADRSPMLGGFGSGVGYAPLSLAGPPGVAFGPPSNIGSYSGISAAMYPHYSSGGRTPVQFEAARIPGYPILPSATYRPQVLPTSTTPIPSSPIGDLILSLPWLNSILNRGNNTITLPDGGRVRSRTKTINHSLRSGGMRPIWPTTPSPIPSYLKISWLKTANDTITLPNGIYQLGLTDFPTVDQSKECNNAYNGTTGRCTLLTNCAHVVREDILITVDVYIPHFCNMDKYAGICCPPLP